MKLEIVNGKDSLKKLLRKLKVKNINIIERRRNIWQEKEEHMKNL